MSAHKLLTVLLATSLGALSARTYAMPIDGPGTGPEGVEVVVAPPPGGQGVPPGSPGLPDTGRINQDQRTQAEWELSRTSERFGFFSQRLESGKNPRAAELMDRIRSLLAAARQEIDAGRYFNVRLFLGQVEALFPELQRLVQEVADYEKQGSSGTVRDSYKNPQPSGQATLGQATDIYRRVLDRATRLEEQATAPNDPKSAAQGD